MSIGRYVHRAVRSSSGTFIGSPFIKQRIHRSHPIILFHPLSTVVKNGELEKRHPLEKLACLFANDQRSFVRQGPNVVPQREIGVGEGAVPAPEGSPPRGPESARYVLAGGCRQRLPAAAPENDLLHERLLRKPTHLAASESHGG